MMQNDYMSRKAKENTPVENICTVMYVLKATNKEVREFTNLYANALVFKE
jgi:hypothetical protein